MYQKPRFNFALFKTADNGTRKKWGKMWCEQDRICLMDFDTRELYYGQRLTFNCGRYEIDGSFLHSLALQDETERTIYDGPDGGLHSIEGWLEFIDCHGVLRHLAAFKHPREYWLFYFYESSNAFVNRAIRDANSGDALILSCCGGYTIISLAHSQGIDPNTMRVKECSGEIIAWQDDEKYTIRCAPAGFTIQKAGENPYQGTHFGVYCDSKDHQHLALRRRDETEIVAGWKAPLKTVIQAPFQRMEGAITASVRFDNPENEKIVLHTIEPFQGRDSIWYFRWYDAAVSSYYHHGVEPYQIGNLLRASYRINRYEGRQDYDYAALAVLWDQQYPNSIIVEKFL